MERGVFFHFVVDTSQKFLFYDRNDAFVAKFGAPNDVISELIGAMVESANPHAAE
jgi:hypothetical protein